MDKTPTHLDLFSGIGGFALAARWSGFRTVAFCEIDKYCRKVLAKNFLSKPDAIGRNGREDNEGKAAAERERSAQIHSNIFDLDGTRYRGVDLITGGFPCQPFSVAGKRGGAGDDRAIWPQMFRVISEARPAWVLGENVPGIIAMELDRVLSDLEGIGYAVRAFVVPGLVPSMLGIDETEYGSSEEGLFATPNTLDSMPPKSAEALHKEATIARPGTKQASESARPNKQSTELANAAGERLEGATGSILQGRILRSPVNGDVSDSECGGQSGSGQSLNAEYPTASRDRETTELVDGSQSCVWEPEPDVGRVAHGIPSRVDRLKGLGNAIVPQVAYEILREIRKLC